MNTQNETTIDEQVITELPAKYNVILKNDNVTPMGFVVEILVNVFSKERQEAIELMLEIHENGSGVAGTYIKSLGGVFEKYYGKDVKVKNQEEFHELCEYVFKLAKKMSPL